MMCDTNWCTYCDNAISPYSDSLYCSEECLKQDALSHHPILGYDFADLQNFPREPRRRPSSSSLCSIYKPQNAVPTLSSSPTLSTTSVSSYSSLYTSASHLVETPYYSFATSCQVKASQQQQKPSMVSLQQHTQPLRL
ncbi:hypothetical protein EC973_002761 [Apophysomyces ossiformis]|uniref:Uncharacterized protein n=1 Tax=Apophysomyces ossiformis TaxID=679940 RepID=A0A8H7ETN8_9FUNG|nr:hypothetical protein EC973_002761 [Apophysomyces ossiformis]